MIKLTRGQLLLNFLVRVSLMIIEQKQKLEFARECVLGMCKLARNEQ